MYTCCVFVEHFSVVSFILIYVSQRICCQVTKCCSEHSILDIESDLFCESSTNHTDWDAYNIPTSPVINCSDIRNIFIKHESYAELNGCIDKTSNDQYVSVSCSQDAETKTGVHLLNKCCPSANSYDHIQRTCIRDANLHSRFEQVFGESAIVFKHTVPNCSTDEVFVEYFSTVHTIQFDGTNLKVYNDSLMPDKFCIEDLVNIDSDKFNINDRHIIIRSCRPRSVCEKIPCMQRCCKADQVMEPRPEGYKICQYHPYKMNLEPTFYNISIPLDHSQKQSFVNGVDLNFCSYDLKPLKHNN